MKKIVNQNPKPPSPGRTVMVWRKGVESPVRVLCDEKSADSLLQNFGNEDYMGRNTHYTLVTVDQDGRRSRLKFATHVIDAVAVDEPVLVVLPTSPISLVGG